MTVHIGNTYIEVTISSNASDVTFPLTVKGSVRPGTFDGLSALSYIDWGVNMTGLIEPGTIPDRSIHLWLPKTYTHPIELSQLSNKVSVRIHIDNIGLMPIGKSFIVWSENKSDVEGTHPELSYGLRSAILYTRATKAMGVDCYGNEVTRRVPKPDGPSSIDAETFAQMLVQSQQDDPRVAEAKATAIQVSQKIYADIATAAKACKLHNCFSGMYTIGPLGGRDTYRKIILDCLVSAFPSLTIAPVEDITDQISVSYKC